MKTKLLFIMENLSNGGAERSLINLLQLLDYSKYEVDLVLFKKKGLFLEQVPAEVNIISTEEELSFMYDNSLRKAFSIKKLKLSFNHIFGTVVSKILTSSGFEKGQYRWKKYYSKCIPKLKKKYDIAISYMEGETTYYLVDKVFADKKIAWVHTDYKKINANIEMDTEYFSKVNYIVTISNECKNVLVDLFEKLEEKIIVLPNLTSSTLIKKMGDSFFPTEYSKEEINILSIGRLTYIKGFDLAIKAAAILKQKNLKFKWFIIGSGELKKELKKLIESNKLEDNVYLLGARVNPYPYIKNAEIIVQSSRYEGKSIVLDESKIFSKPIVVTKYDTVFEQVSDDEGIKVDINEQAIAKGIEDMLKNEKKYVSYLEKKDYGNDTDILKYYELFEKK